MTRKQKKIQGLHRHHRLPKSLGGSNSNRNISFVTQTQHRGWHTLFSNHTAPTICGIINEKWLDPAYKFICVPADKVDTINKYIKSLT